MEMHEIYEKHLCMTDLRVERFETTDHRRVEVPQERQEARFLYVFKGEAILQSPQHRLCAAAGDVLYLPEDSGDCHIFWSGTTGIAYIALRIVSKRFDMVNTERYIVQRVGALSTTAVGDTFSAIHTLFCPNGKSAEQCRIDRVRAIGLYYAFYADVLPHLITAPPVQYSAILRDAVAYIDNHLASNFDMDTLSQAVCISSSHLHHLFRAGLGTTPIQYRNERRIASAAWDLRNTEESIAVIAAKNGFHSAIYFHRIFRTATGMTPREYREETQNRL